MRPDGSDSHREIQRWLDRLRNGDCNARHRLLTELSGRVRALAARYLQKFPGLSRWVESDDVAQNVFIRLEGALQRERTLATLTSPGELLGFAGSLIRLELIDLIRRFTGPAGGILRVADGPPPDAPDASLDPGELARWEALHEYIAARPAEERVLFDTLYYQGLTQEVAADVLGVPLRTLRRRWLRARLRLTDRLGDNAPSAS